MGSAFAARGDIALSDAALTLPSASRAAAAPKISLRRESLGMVRNSAGRGSAHALELARVVKSWYGCLDTWRVNVARQRVNT
jgi:hypothetical protein